LHGGYDQLEGSGALIQVYTGKGKGKTTAALGLALRAAGAGLKVYICQFLKGRDYCELDSLRKLKNVKVEQFGTKCFVKKFPTLKDKESARLGLEAAKKAINCKIYNVVILDEVNVALRLNLIKLSDVIGLIKKAPAKLELVLTGRYAPAEVLKLADLVSEIKEVKHYFQKGVAARKGIEF
jgi:cob(I)alamin adenosyltransferase